MKAMKSTMKNNYIPIKLIMLGIIVTLGCERQEIPLPAATYPSTAEVFMDEFSPGLEYAAFGDSKLTAFTVDENVSFEDVLGSSSMRFDVPYEGDPEGPYAGGIFRDLDGRDLTGYNALTFYAQGSRTGTIDRIGFGNDFMGDQYSTTTSLRLNTTWTKYILPIPDPSKLTQEKGLLIVSEGPEDGEGYSIWIDQVKFENLGTIAQPRAAIFGGDDISRETFIGISTQITNLTYTVNLPNGADQTVSASPLYYNFVSSDTLVARVNEVGVISVVGQGTAKITASIGELEALGSLTLVSQGEFVNAPVPDRPDEDVISIFSDAYTNVDVDFYNGYFAPFQTTQGQDDIEINGDNVIKYTELNFVATEFKDPTVDATNMTHFHVDIQVENAIATGDFIKVQLGDFGPDGAFGGDDDATGTYEIKTSPPLVSNEWMSLDIPLSDFSGLTQKANMAQIFFVTDGTNPDLPGTITDILVDNMYFYKDGGGSTAPTTSAPVPPTRDAADVISIYGESYTNITDINYDPDWGQSGHTFVNASYDPGDGNLALAYPSFTFQGTDFDSNVQDASAMEFLHIDIWVPSGTDRQVKVSPINGGTGGTGTGESLVEVPLTPGSWNSVDLPIGDFTGMTWDAVNQLKFDGQFNGDGSANTASFDVYLDNIYFYKTGGGSTAPTTSAPVPPTRDAADVISIYGESYTNITDINYDPDWGQSGHTLVNASYDPGDGNLALAYPSFTFQGTDFNSNVQDASAMEFLHIDIWVPSGTDRQVKVSPINGGTGGTGTGEFLVEVPLTPGSWNSVDLPIGDFTGMTWDAVNQLKFDGQFNGDGSANTASFDVYLDNIYFYKEGGGGTCQAETGQSMDASDFDMTFQTDPGSAIGSFGGAYSYIDNPDFDNAVNPSCKVGQITRDGQQFANTQIEFDSKFDFNANAGFKLKVWSPTAGTNVLVKLEDKTNADVNTEVSAVTTTASAWEELTFDFASGESGKHDKIILFFELDSNVEETYYIDDFRLYGSGGETCQAETSQSMDASDFDMTFQTDPGSAIGSFGGAYSYIDNPDFDNAVNPSCKVGQITRDGQQFANTQIEFDSKFDFNANAGFKLKVWSPTAGTNVLVKLEDKTNADVNTEVSAVTTTASAWEELTFDFASGESGKHDKIILFFELDSNVEETYYIDDFRLYGSGGETCQAETSQSMDASDFDMTFQTDPGSAIGSFGGAYSYIDNPDFDNAVNPSCKVGQITRDGQQFANTQIEFDSKFDFNANAGFKLKVWSPTAGTNVLVKLEDKTNADVNTEVSAVTTTASAWEELTFDFASGESGKHDKIILFFELDSNVEETYYIDDFRLYGSGGGGPSAPTDAPAAPPARDAADVISIYGEAYGAEIGLANVDWDLGSTFAEETIAGNKLLKIDFADFLGTQLNTVVDATAMTNFHMDVWIADDFEAGQIFNPKWSNHTGGAGETNAFELTKPVGDTDAKKWIAIDVPLTDFAGDATRADLTQFLIAVAGKIDVAYVDNIYFYKTGGGECADPTAAPTAPTRAAADVISVFSDAYTDIANTNFNPGWGQSTVVTTETIGGESTLKYDNFNFQGTNLGGADGVDQDLSTMEFLHIDIWTCDATVVKVTPISRSSGENLVSLTPIANGQWNSYDIPLSDFSGVSMTDIYQIKFDGQEGTTPSKIFVDNIFFYKTDGGSSNDPDVAAPAPPDRDAANVVSIFSDAYTNITLNNDDAGWCGDDAASVVSIEGNNTWKKNAGIDCHGIDFSTNKQDLSAYTHIHFDFYTDDTDLTGAVFNVKLVDFGGGGGEASALEVNINTGTTPGIVSGSWVSVDIDITSLEGVVAGNLTRSDIAQIGITTANLTNVWYDNIYLYK
jgi:hypothetical protein